MEQYQLEFLPPMSLSEHLRVGSQRAKGASHQLKTISNLKQVGPDIRAGFSLNLSTEQTVIKACRQPGITPKHIVSLNRPYAITALLNDKIDLVEALSTDAELNNINCASAGR